MNGYGGAAIGWAVNGDRASLGFDQPLGSRESESSASDLRREEGRKDFVADVSRNSRAVIGKRDRAELTVATKLDAKLATPSHGVRAVDHEVLKHDLQQLGVDVHQRRRSLHLDLHTIHIRVPA